MGKGPRINGIERPEFGNFFLSSFYVDGIEYASVEHYYQYMKSCDPGVREAATPQEAYRLGQKCTLPPDWDTLKIFYMKIGVLCKITQDPTLCALLLATGEDEITFMENGHTQDEWDRVNGHILTNVREMISLETVKRDE
jgi:predicted NAD-dependent protein-ADP-ribosyltransferase YbiA (DUF1768 family)